MSTIGTSRMASAKERNAAKPCPRCYSAMTVEGKDWRCPRHGLLSAIAASPRPTPPPPVAPPVEPPPVADPPPPPPPPAEPTPPLEQDVAPAHTNGAKPPRRVVRPALSDDAILDRLDLAVAELGEEPHWSVFSKANPWVSSSTLNRRFGGIPAALAARRARLDPVIVEAPPVAPQEPVGAPAPPAPDPTPAPAAPERTDAPVPVARHDDGTFAAAAARVEAAHAAIAAADDELEQALNALWGHPLLLELHDRGWIDAVDIERALAA